MSCLPHARGGVSGRKDCSYGGALSSPRTWGCFPLLLTLSPPLQVFPTHVGVFLLKYDIGILMESLPHARGGVSFYLVQFCTDSLSSPRTWGCFRIDVLPHSVFIVFPTHVGVFLITGKFRNTMCRLPHARGGVSFQSPAWRVFSWSSPRTWGCFFLRCSRRVRYFVFPTHVGVFLVNWAGANLGKGLPHARGGVSALFVAHAGVSGSSPRTWGCFPVHDRNRAVVRSSPRTWGCFPVHDRNRAVVRSSPRTWGCFRLG